MAYQKTIWSPGDTISSAKLNNIEEGIVGLETGADTDRNLIFNGTKTTINKTFTTGAIDSYDFAVHKGCAVKITISDWTTSDYYMAVAFYLSGSTTNQQATVITSPGTYTVTAEKDYAQIAIWSRSAASMTVVAEILGINDLSDEIDDLSEEIAAADTRVNTALSGLSDDIEATNTRIADLEIDVEGLEAEIIDDISDSMTADRNLIFNGVRQVNSLTFTGNTIQSYDFAVPKGYAVKLTVTDWDTNDHYMAISFYVSGSTANQQATVITAEGSYPILTEKDYAKIAVWSRVACTMTVIAEITGISGLQEEINGLSEDIDDLSSDIADTNARVDDLIENLPEHIGDDTERVDSIMDVTGFPVYLSGTYSATQIKTINTDIPAGEYLISVDNITSTDTDRNCCLINFDTGNGSVTTYFPRGQRYKKIITLPSRVTTVYLYASDGITRSSGDTFTFTNLTVGKVSQLTESLLAGCEANAALTKQAVLIKTSTTVLSQLVQVMLNIYAGQTVCVVVSSINGTGKGYWIGFGDEYAGGNYQQAVHISGPGITRIVAAADYSAAYVLFDSSSVTSAKVTVYIEGNERRYGNFSILGDSYSAFDGFIPEDYPSWYPESAVSSSNDCTDVTATWWFRFAKDFRCALQLNESYSGSPVCNDGYGAGTTDATDKSFITRMTGLPQSDLILVFGGTNDSWIGVEIGEYMYSEWTTADLSHFRPAMAYMLDYLTKHHVGAKIVFIKNTGLSTDIAGSIDTICDHYGVTLLELTNTVTKAGNHPDAVGMAEIYAQLIDCLVTE